MKKLYIIAMLSLIALMGCDKSKDVPFGDKGAPKVEYIVDPNTFIKSNTLQIGQMVQVVGANLKSTKRIALNGKELPLGDGSKVSLLTNAIFFNVPRIPRAESYTLEIENKFGSVKYAVDVKFPPLQITGILNEWAAPGTEMTLFGESMDLHIVAGVTQIKFNDLTTTATAVEETSIKLTVPAGAPEKAVIKVVLGDGNELVSPVRYRDCTLLLEDLENSATTLYPAFVVPNATYPEPLNPAPTQGNSYSRIVTKPGQTGSLYMVGNNTAIPLDYFKNHTDYELKFELCTQNPIAYRIAVSLNRTSAWIGYGPSAMTTDPALMVSTDGKWQTVTIPMYTWRNVTSNTGLRIWIGSTPSALNPTYDFCLDNFRIQKKIW